MVWSESFGGREQTGDNPTITFTVTPPEAVTHTSMNYHGSFSAGGAWFWGEPGQAVPPAPASGAFTFTARFGGNVAEKVEGTWLERRNPPYSDAGWLGDNYTRTARPAVSFDWDAPQQTGPWWRRPEIGTFVRREGGGPVTATFSGTNLMGQFGDYQYDNFYDNFYGNAGSIGLSGVSFQAHEANLRVLGVERVDNTVKSASPSVTPSGEPFYAGEQVIVSVLVTDDWGDPVQTTVRARDGSYDAEVVKPHEGATGANGVAKVLVDLKKAGDAGFTLETPKGGEAEVALVAAADEYDVTLNPLPAVPAPLPGNSTITVSGRLTVNGQAPTVAQQANMTLRVRNAPAGIGLAPPAFLLNGSFTAVLTVTGAAAAAGHYQIQAFVRVGNEAVAFDEVSFTLL